MSSDGVVGTRALGVDFPVTREDRFLEDYEPGAVFEYGFVCVSEAEILDFARLYDPQRFHTDPVWAVEGPFGGLIASGWQTAGLFMRLFAGHYLPSGASLGSPGVDALVWPRPVRPGDQLRLRATVLECRPSSSKPDRGLVRTKGELYNEEDKAVFGLEIVNFLLRRGT